MPSATSVGDQDTGATVGSNERPPSNKAFQRTRVAPPLNAAPLARGRGSQLAAEPSFVGRTNKKSDQPRRLVQFSTSTRLKGAKSFTFSVTSVSSFT
jgi:hypothetical protein